MKVIFTVTAASHARGYFDSVQFGVSMMPNSVILAEVGGPTKTYGPMGLALVKL